MRHLLLPSLLVLSSACGGQVSGPVDAGDAAASDAPVGFDVYMPDARPPPPPFDGGAACNAVALLGADVTGQGLAQDAPPIATFDQPPQPATYALESATFYNGKGGTSGPMGKTSVTLRIENDRSTYQVALSQDGQPVEHRTYQLTKAGLGLVLDGTCGTNDSTPVAFIPINSPGFVLVATVGNTTVYELFRPFIK